MFHVYAQTDVGRSREHNEDALIVADLAGTVIPPAPEPVTRRVSPRGALFMIADGMGGAAAGEVASALAVETVLQEMRQRVAEQTSVDADGFVDALRAATESANRTIHSYAVAHPEHRGMGTTATIAAVLGDTLYVAQVGDSRAYLVRDGVAYQITKDQSLLQRLVEAGELTEEQAERSERRNIILQALGPEVEIRTDLTFQQLRRGDTLVLCSDGLTGQVRADEIAHAVTNSADLAEAGRHLIDEANEAGGPDNITVIAVRFDGDGLPISRPDDGAGHRVFPTGDDASGEDPLGPTRRPWTEPGDEASGVRDALSPDEWIPREHRGPSMAMLILALLLLVFAVYVAVQAFRTGA
jgi:protein phosphatase